MFKLKLLKFYYKISSNLLPKYFETHRDVIERAPVRKLRQHYNDNDNDNEISLFGHKFIQHY